MSEVAPTIKGETASEMVCIPDISSFSNATERHDQYQKPVNTVAITINSKYKCPTNCFESSAKSVICKIPIIPATDKNLSLPSTYNIHM